MSADTFNLKWISANITTSTAGTWTDYNDYVRLRDWTVIANPLWGITFADRMSFTKRHRWSKLKERITIL